MKGEFIRNSFKAVGRGKEAGREGLIQKLDLTFRSDQARTGKRASAGYRSEVSRESGINKRVRPGEVRLKLLEARQLQTLVKRRDYTGMMRVVTPAFFRRGLGDNATRPNLLRVAKHLIHEAKRLQRKGDYKAAAKLLDRVERFAGALPRGGGAKGVVAELRQERARIECAIASLVGLGSQPERRGRPPRVSQAKPAGSPKRRTPSSAARKRISAAMKQQWEQRKGKSVPKKAQPSPKSRPEVSGQKRGAKKSAKKKQKKAYDRVSPALMGPPDSSFYFVLEGEGARCDQVLWGSTFDLVFRYDMLPADVLAGLKGRKLDDLLKKKVDLYINVQPVALTITDDLPGAVAHFEDGKMTGKPPRFHLKAPEKGSCPPAMKCGVDITFFADRALLYRFFLEIRPVEKLDETAAGCRKQTIDLDLAEVFGSSAEKRDAVLFITKQGGTWSVYYDIDGVQSPARAATLGPADLASEYGTHDIITDVAWIAGKAVWKQIDSKLEIPEEPELKNEMLECTRTLMTVGSKLYGIFTKDQVFKTTFDLIEKLKPGSKIAILTDVAFPWELLYPLYYDRGPEKSYQPGQFWGRRFQIEQLLYASTEAEKLPEERSQPGRFYVSMGLNESIDKDWEGRPLLPVKFQKDYCDSVLSGRGEHMEAQDQIEGILKNPCSASFIYFFCHGDENHLKFEEAKRPVEAHSLSPERYSGWPLVFLNACSVGNISPLSFDSFRTRFRDKRAAGLVAPSFPIPTLFAAVFGKTVLDEYAAHRPIGQILFDLRSRLLDQGNPLGLLYSLQCPLDVRAPE